VSRAPRDGPVKSHLEQLIGRHSRESGVAADRVRRWVSTMALLGALERAAPDDALPLFLLKGGVAIEGVRTGARATKDVDVVFGGEPGELLDALDAAFAEPYCDFAFRRGAPAEHGPHATRFDVRLDIPDAGVGHRAPRDLRARARRRRARVHRGSACRTSSSQARNRSPACHCAFRSHRSCMPSASGPSIAPTTASETSSIS